MSLGGMMSLGKEVPKSWVVGKQCNFSVKFLSKNWLFPKNIEWEKSNIFCTLNMLNWFSHVKTYILFLIKYSEVTALCFVRGLTMKSACFTPNQDGYFI